MPFLRLSNEKRIFLRAVLSMWARSFGVCAMLLRRKLGFSRWFRVVSSGCSVCYV